MAKQRKLKIAVTGSIGSGKSTFSGFIKDEGFPVIIADEISKDILTNDTTVKERIKKNFGSKAYNGDILNKKFLAEEIFTDPKKLNKINSIIHPLVRKEIESLANEFFTKHRYVFVEAAIIFESGIAKMYDYVVLITSDEKIREERVVKSKKFSWEDFNKRNKTQLNEEVKINKADFVFYNNGSKADLKKKASLLIAILDSMKS